MSVGPCLFPSREQERPQADKYSLISRLPLLTSCHSETTTICYLVLMQLLLHLCISINALYLVSVVSYSYFFCRVAGVRKKGMWGNCPLNTGGETPSRFITIISPAIFHSQSSGFFTPHPTLTSKSHVTLHYLHAEKDFSTSVNIHRSKAAPICVGPATCADVIQIRCVPPAHRFPRE